MYNNFDDEISPSKNKINLDYDFNTEFGDGDIPDIDKPRDLLNEEDDDEEEEDEEEEDEFD